MKKKIPKEISEHFKKLGQASWEARKRKILDKIVIPKQNVKEGLQTNER